MSDTAILSFQKNSIYQGLTVEQITFIQKWSWGAFFSPIVWALGNKLYLWALGCLVPLFNIYVWIKLASGGRAMAWEEGNWKDFEQFKKRQKIMMVIIVLLFVVGLASRVSTFSMRLTQDRSGMFMDN